MSLYFCEKQMVDSCTLDEKGAFKFELNNISAPCFFDLGSKDLVFAKQYFIQDGDEINLDFIGSEMPIALKSYEDIGTYNKFLQTFNDTFYREPNVKRTYFVISNFMLAPDYALYINNRKNEQVKFFENYFKDQNIDTTFQYFFEKETNFNWANDKVYFLWKKRTRMEEVPIDTNYFDFLKDINTDDPKALICPAYIRFVDLYLKELYQEEIFTLPKGTPQSLEKCRLAKKYLKGMGQKIAFYNILRDELHSLDANFAANKEKQNAYIEELLSIASDNGKEQCYQKFVSNYRH